METRFLLPGRRTCLCQGKGAGREACCEDTELWLDGTMGSPRKLLGPAAFSGRASAHSWGLNPLEMVSCPGR